MWTKCISSKSRFVVLSFLFCSGLLAQSTDTKTVIPQNTTTNNTSSRTQSVQIAPTLGNLGVESETVKELSNRLPNLEQGDSFDPQSGTFTWKGKTFDIGSSRMVRSRFERYLNSRSQADEMRPYQAILKEVFALLSVNGDAQKKTENIESAWNLLPEAGKYNCDGGNSLIVATYVYNAFRARAEIARADFDAKRAAGMQKNLIQWIDSKQDAAASDPGQQLLRKRLEMQGKPDSVDLKKSGNLSADADETNVAVGSGINLMALAAQPHSYYIKKDVFVDLAEATKLRAIAESNYSAIRTHLDFQSAMVNFLVQRRFQHALLLVRFYNQLFKSSVQSLEVGKEQLAALWQNAADLNPTVGSIELLSREALLDVSNGMQSVYVALENEELYLAFERLQEIFYLGEYTPEVLSFPEKDRRSIYQLYKKIQELQTLIDLKDYAAVEGVAKQAKSLAKDFPETQILSLIRSVQRLSDVSLLTAQQYFAAKEYMKGEEYLKKAVELWPLNPSIKNFTEGMVASSSGMEQGKLIFDQLYASQNYREIYNRRAELGLALSTDSERARYLKEVLERIAKIDVLIAQSREMVAQKNPYGAWECLVQASDLDTNDIMVNKEKVMVVSQVTGFVDKLNKAEIAEKAGNYAIALNYYVAANDEYPMSQICRKGIERNSTAYLNSLKKKPKSSVPEQ